MKAPSKLLQGVSLLFLCAAACAKAAPLTSESDLKAVFLYHFTQFVEWPGSVFPSSNAPFIIGIMGTDPFGDSLQNIVQGEKVGSHPLVVREVSEYPEERNCQILYVSKDAESQLDTSRLKRAPVLTVGESSAFYDAGGIVEFVTEHRHVRLRVNLTAARFHSLVISAKLLRVSEVSDAGPVMMRIFDGWEAARMEIPQELSRNGQLGLLLGRSDKPVFKIARPPQIFSYN